MLAAKVATPCQSQDGYASRLRFRGFAHAFLTKLVDIIGCSESFSVFPFSIFLFESCCKSCMQHLSGPASNTSGVCQGSLKYAVHETQRTLNWKSDHRRARPDAVALAASARHLHLTAQSGVLGSLSSLFRESSCAVRCRMVSGLVCARWCHFK